MPKYDPDVALLLQKKPCSTAGLVFSSTRFKKLFYLLLLLSILISISSCVKKPTLPNTQYQIKQTHDKYSSNYTICDNCLNYTIPNSLKTNKRRIKNVQ